MLESLAKLSKILVAICFFFSQTNLVFISNLVFIDILGSFCQSSYLLIVAILRSLNFIQCLHAFLIKTSKILMRFNIIFLGFSVSKCSSYVLFSMKHSFLPTAKITHNNCATHNNNSCKSSAVQTQLLVSDYGLYEIEVVCICQVTFFVSKLLK